MRNSKWVLTTCLALSAIMLNLALFFPEYLYYLVFIFLVPVFFLVFTFPNALGFWQGFLWGLIFFSIHSSGFIFLFYSQANGVLRVCIPVVLAFYFAIYSGLWFLFANKTSLIFENFVFKNNIFARQIIWGFWAFLYFNWIRYGVFWIFGDFVGYPLSYPLLPLASNNITLSLLGIIGKTACLVLIILFSLLCSWLFSRKKYTLLSLFLLLLFLLFSFFNKKIVKPVPVVDAQKDVSHIGYISPIDIQKFDKPLDIAQEIFYKMVKLVEKKPDMKMIFMPESSCTFCLNKHQEIIDLWYDNILNDLDGDISVFIGAPYKEGDLVFNSLYWIKNGKIKQVYNKTNLMAFTEYVPNFWCNITYLKNLFLDDNKCLSHGKKGRIIFDLCKNIKFRPFICSDFFLIKRKNCAPIDSKNQHN